MLTVAVNWDTYWLFVLTELALSASPGPAVMLVIAYGLAHGARRALFVAAGVLSANALYFAVSATALGAILIASRGFFVTVKWLGAAYLVYIGASALRGRSSPITVSSASAQRRRTLYLPVGFDVAARQSEDTYFLRCDSAAIR